MKHFLRFSLVSMLLLVCGAMMAQKTVTFDATKDVPATGATSQGKQVITKGDITLTLSSGVVTNGQYRIYKSSTVTIETAKGNLNKVVFTCTANGEVKYGPGCFAEATGYKFEAAGKTGTWEGNASKLTLTASSNQVRATEITVTYNDGGVQVAAPVFSVKGGMFTSPQEVTLTAAAGNTIYYTTDGSDPTTASTKYTAPIAISTNTTLSAIAADAAGNTSGVVSETYTFPAVVASIAEFNKLATGTIALLTLTDAQVVYVNNYNNTTDIFVRDATGAFDIYRTALDLKVGQMLNGTIVLKNSPYNGLNEALAVDDATNLDKVTVTDGEAVQPRVISVEDALDNRYVADLVKISGATITSVAGTSRTDYFANSEAGDELSFYDRYKTGATITADDDKAYDITGILGSAKSGTNFYNQLWLTAPIVEHVTTGINGVEADKADAPAFNIAGQRVGNGYKGLVIKNGKKYVVK